MCVCVWLILDTSSRVLNMLFFNSKSFSPVETRSSLNYRWLNLQWALTSLLHVQCWHAMFVVNVFRIVQLCLKTYTTSVTLFQNRLLERNMGTLAQRRQASYFPRAIKTAEHCYIQKYIMNVLQVFIERTSIASSCVEQRGLCIAMLKQVYLECVFKLAKVSTNEF